MESTTTTPMKGRRAAIALGVAAAIAVIILGWLGAPLAVDEWWIRKLRSSDEAEVRAAIEKINERKVLRAAPVLLSILGESESPVDAGWVPPPIWPFGYQFPPVALAVEALGKLDRPPGWFISRIESGSETERKAAIYWAGAMEWKAAVPALRRVVEGNGPLAPVAALALARILPVIRVEKISTEEGPNARSTRKVRLRFSNPTGRSLWFIGKSLVQPILGRGKIDANGLWTVSGPTETFPGAGPREFPPDSSFVLEEVMPVGMPALRLFFNLSHSTSMAPPDLVDQIFESWDVVTVKIDVLEAKAP